jgi:hypothetical protein
VLVRTEVPDALARLQNGGELTATAVEASALRVVVPECPLAHSWLYKPPRVVDRSKIACPTQ